MHNLILTLLIFSSMEVVSRPLMGLIDPFVLTFYRFVMGFALLFFISLSSGKLRTLFKIDGKMGGLLFVLGFLNTFFSMSMLQLAVKSGGAAIAAVIFCSNPLFVYPISLMMGMEKFSMRKAAGLLVGVAALFIMKGAGVGGGMGIVYALLASGSFAIYTVLNKKALAKIDPVTVNVGAFAFGIAVSIIYLLVSGRSMSLPAELFSSTGKTVSFLYLGFIVSGFAYITFIKSIKQFSPFAASLLFIVKPFLATVFAILFLKEMPSSGFYIGMVILTFGAVLMTGTGSFNMLKAKS